KWSFRDLPAAGTRKAIPHLLTGLSLLFIEEPEMFRDLDMEPRCKRKWFGARTAEQDERVVSILTLVDRFFYWRIQGSARSASTLRRMGLHRSGRQECARRAWRGGLRVPRNG